MVLVGKGLVAIGWKLVLGLSKIRAWSLLAIYCRSNRIPHQLPNEVISHPRVLGRAMSLEAVQSLSTREHIVNV